MTLEFDFFRISHPEYSRASPVIGVAMSRASEYTDTFHIEKFDSALHVLRDPDILDTPRSKFAGPSLVVRHSKVCRVTISSARRTMLAR